jgi:hypothetical protein
MPGVSNPHSSKKSSELRRGWHQSARLRSGGQGWHAACEYCARIAAKYVPRASVRLFCGLWSLWHQDTASGADITRVRRRHQFIHDPLRAHAMRTRPGAVWRGLSGPPAHGSSPHAVARWQVSNVVTHTISNLRLTPAIHRCRGYQARRMPTSTHANCPSALQMWNRLVFSLNVDVRSTLVLARSESSLVTMRSQSDSDIIAESHFVCERHWVWSSIGRILARTANGNDARATRRNMAVRSAPPPCAVFSEDQ